MNILVSDAIDESALNILRNTNLFSVAYKPDISSEALLAEIGEYEILVVRSRTKVTSAVLQAAKKLKLIGRVGTGTDNIDKKTAHNQSITVINAPGANSQAVCELTIGFMLSLLRKIPFAVASTRNGEWKKKELKGFELNAKKIGIVGYGAIGKKVATVVQAFGATILKHDKDDTRENLELLFAQSDIITLHTVLVDATRNMVNKKLLSLMKKEAYLINCARAEIIAEDDLFETLSEKKIAGAALDVLWQEPIEPTSRWLTLDNVLLTPHIGGQTYEAASTAANIVVSDIIKFAKGETPDHVVL